jgi:Tetracyclin repressor-like, C-terminal domain
MGVRQYAERMSRLTVGTDSFWARSQAGLENYMTFAQEYPELYQLVFERPVPGFVPSEESMAESRRLLAMSDEIVEKGIERGSVVLGITVEQARDLFIAMMHGLTALHMANEPELPIGSGRFGSLIPAAIALFRAAWEPEPSKTHDEQTEKK